VSCPLSVSFCLFSLRKQRALTVSRWGRFGWLSRSRARFAPSNNSRTGCCVHSHELARLRVISLALLHLLLCSLFSPRLPLPPNPSTEDNAAVAVRAVCAAGCGMRALLCAAVLAVLQRRRRSSGSRMSDRWVVCGRRKKRTIHSGWRRRDAVVTAARGGRRSVRYTGRGDCRLHTASPCRFFVDGQRMEAVTGRSRGHGTGQGCMQQRKRCQLRPFKRRRC